MKKFLLVLAMLISFTSCFAQVKSQKKQTKVALLKWTSLPCDNTTYDPDRLQNRITNLTSQNGITSITVNFSDNCCARFKPVIEFKDNKLLLLPYLEYTANYCLCNCCFSINFEIQGLENKNYEIYFKDEKVELSFNHYKTVEPSQEIYNGEIINRVNKYGFKEGKWIDFYENGAEKRIIKYPESSIYREPRDEWFKGFSESGKLVFFYRKDTTESWYEDGELKSQTLTYSSGDTTFEKSFRKYENRQIQERYSKKSYPIIWRSKSDSTYKNEGTITEYLYNEEYYSSGQTKYLKKIDTSYTWFENGKIKLKSYEAGEIEYDENGQLSKRIFRWEEPGARSWRSFSHALYIDYFGNDHLKRIHFVRDELGDDGKSIAPSIHYYWTWDKELNLIEAPEKWNEAYPWEKFEELKILLRKYKLR